MGNSLTERTEIIIAKEQILHALEQNQKKRSDKNLIHDYLTDALHRITKLTNPVKHESKPLQYAIEVLQAQRDEHLQAMAMDTIPDSSIEIVERQINELLTAINKLKL